MAGRQAMTVLVTGGTGFLGGRVVERLVLEKHANVRVLLRSVGSASRIASLPVDFRRGDASDPVAFAQAAEGCDVVIHCASRIDHAAPKRTSTFLGTRTAAKVCADLDIRLIHVSSSAVYGNPDAPVVDEAQPHRPRHRGDVYALAKIEAERAVRAACSEGVLRAAVLRPTMIYGPYSGEWTLAPLAMLSAADLWMPDPDTSICNAVYVDDVVSAILLAIDVCDTACPSYLINGDELPSWTGFLARHAALGTPGRVLPAPGEEIERLRRDARRQRSLARTLLRIAREQPDFRAQLLATNLVGGGFSLFQKLAPVSAFDSVKAHLTGRGAPAAPVVARPAAAALPVQLPLPHFLDLAGQQHRYSNAKAEAELGYIPRWSLDRAFETIGAWARWSRLVPEAVSPNDA